MANYLNRAKEATATTGTGTVTLSGTASSGFKTWSAAGAVNGAEYSYLITDGSAWEVGVGTYTSSGTTLSRTLTESSTGALLNLTGNAVVSQIAAAHDLKFRGARVKKAADQTTANYTTATAVAWTAEEFDTDAFHDNSTNNTRLTVPTGLGINYVEITAGVRLELVTADLWVNIFVRKNGVAADVYGGHRSEAGSTSPRLAVETGPIAVVDGDYFELFLEIETDTSVTVSAHPACFAAIKVLG